MRLPIRVWAGLYGLAFHAAALAITLWIARRNQAEIPASFWWTAGPAFLVAGFVVYALLVGRYLPRRPSTRGAFFFDSAVGMLAEAGVVAVTSALYALVVSTRALEGGIIGYLGAVARTTVFAFLFSVGSFFLQILVVGNAAGILGFWLLRKLNARRPPPGLSPPA